MLHRSWVTILILLLCACGDGDGAGNVANPYQQQGPSGPAPVEALEQSVAGLDFDDFVRVSFEALAQRDPEFVIGSGDPGLEPVYTSTAELPPLGLTDISPEYDAQTEEMYAFIAQHLATFDSDSLSAEQRLTHLVYEWYVNDRLEGLLYPEYPFPASYFITSVPSRTAFFFDERHPLETESDARDYVARLAMVDEKFQQLIDNVRSHRQRGAVMPRQMLDWSIASHGNIANATTAEQTVYYQRVAADIGFLPDAVQNEILDEARSIVITEIIPAYQLLVAELESQRAVAPAAVGVGQQPNGNAFYEHALRRHTGTDLTADEIHAIGLNQLSRIHDEMRDRFDTLGYPAGDTIRELYVRLGNDTGFEPAGQIVAAYEQIIDEAYGNLPAAFDQLPVADVIVSPGPVGGVYLAPAIDGSRPGTFFVSTTNLDLRFQMKSLAYHEAVPGHHLQIALAQEQGFTAFRRHITYTGFVEGWALYAERLAFELGWYADDVEGDLGRLQYEAFRAARLVVDTGIHDRGWTFEQAVDFFEANTGFSRGASQGQIARYIAWPAQATAYLIGMLEILELRDARQTALGADFDIKEFHNVLLTSGAVPLELLPELFE